MLLESRQAFRFSYYSVLFLSSLSLLFLFDIIMISFCLYFVNSNSNILFFEY